MVFPDDGKESKQFDDVLLWQPSPTASETNARKKKESKIKKKETKVILQI